MTEITIPKGEVKCSKHYKGTVFLTSMDLRLFPFDCQNLQVTSSVYRFIKLSQFLVHLPISVNISENLNPLLLLNSILDLLQTIQEAYRGGKEMIVAGEISLKSER